MDTFVFQFVFCPELSFDTSLYYSVERAVCIDKKCPIDTTPHKGLEPLTVGLKVQRSTDWASGATWIPLFSCLFSVPSYLLTLCSITVLKEPFASTKRVANWYSATQGTRTLDCRIKSPTLYRLSQRGYMDTFAFQFVFCPELSFDTSLYYSVEWAVCIDKKCIQLILRPQGTRTLDRWIKSPTLYRLS